MPDPAPRPPTQPARSPDREESSRPPLIPRNRGFIALLLGLLAINLFLSFLTGEAPERQQVPYQPFFIDQLRAGNVEQISSQADSFEGELAKTTYRPPGASSSRLRSWRRSGEGRWLRRTIPRQRLRGICPSHFCLEMRLLSPRDTTLHLRPFPDIVLTRC
jgi:hypothetical protein